MKRKKEFKERAIMRDGVEGLRDEFVCYVNT